MIAEGGKDRVNDPWPDYVFESDYRLSNLEELEVFIDTYEPLPGIPSAEEMDVVDLAKMNLLLLEPEICNRQSTVVVNCFETATYHLFVESPSGASVRLCSGQHKHPSKHKRTLALGTVRKSKSSDIIFYRFRLPNRGLQVIDYTEVHLVQPRH